MSIEQYRCLVAHMIYWERGMDEAIRDAGISIAKEDVISQLWKAGYTYDEEADRLIYEE